MARIAKAAAAGAIVGHKAGERLADRKLDKKETEHRPAGNAHKFAALAALAAAAGHYLHRPGMYAVAAIFAASTVPVSRLERRDARRRTETEALYGIIADTLKNGAPIHGRAKWHKGRLTEMSVRYLHRADDSPANQAKLARRLGDRMGCELDLTWRTDRRSLRVVRRAPTPPAVARARTVVAVAFGDHATFAHPVIDGDRLVSFAVEHGDHRDADPAWRADRDHLVNVKTGTAWTSRWDLATDTVTYTARAAMPSFVAHPAGILPGSQKIPFGVYRSGETATWDPLSSDDQPSPHLLVIGTSGSGKSVLLRGVIVEAAGRGYQVACIDPKRVSLRGMKDWPGVTEIATDLNAMIDIMDRTHRLVEARYARLEAGTAQPSDLTPHLLVIDETTELIERCNRAWKDAKKPGEHPAVAQYRSIARLGREGRVHLVICIQRPDAAVLSGEARDNLAARITLGKVSKTASRMMENDTAVDTDAPRGRAIATLGGVEREVQVWWTPAPPGDTSEDRAVLKALRPHLPAQTTMNTPQLAAVDTPKTAPVDARPKPLPAPLADDKVKRIYEMLDRDPPASYRTIAAEVGVSVAVVGKYAKAPRRPHLRVVRDEPVDLLGEA